MTNWAVATGPYSLGLFKGLKSMARSKAELYN